MDIKLIIGLGNPDLPAGRQGKKYNNTYHNVGFLAVDYFSKTLPPKADPPRSENPTPYTLLTSNVYMNESGKFVAKEVKKSGAKPEELLIIHDDSDIEIGKYKLSFGRGAAGHHGVESVQTALKTNDFWRLRIGIRSAADQRRTNADSRRNNPRPKAGEFVLKKISPADKKILEEVFEESSKELAK